MKLIDTHTHLDHLEDAPAALTRAKEQGVLAVMAASVDLNSSRKNLALLRDFQEDWPRIFFAAGIHPSEAGKDDWEDFNRFVEENHREMFAVGEIGLDFWYQWVRKDEEKKQQQKKLFRASLEIAGRYDLPAIIHSRGAWKECLSMVKESGHKKNLFHWYSGPVDALKDVLDYGCYVSCTPALAYSTQLQEAMRYAPVDRILIETDCPVGYRIEKNEKWESYQAQPKDIFKTLGLLADLKQLNPEGLADIVNRNAEKFFAIPSLSENPES